MQVGTGLHIQVGVGLARASREVGKGEAQIESQLCPNRPVTHPQGERYWARLRLHSSSFEVRLHGCPVCVGLHSIPCDPTSAQHRMAALIAWGYTASHVIQPLPNIAWLTLHPCVHCPLRTLTFCVP